MQKIVEVRVLTRRLDEPCFVAAIFSDGQQWTYESEFPTVELAESFAAGVRNGLRWQAKVIADECVRMGAWTGGHGAPPTPTCSAVAALIERELLS